MRRNILVYGDSNSYGFISHSMDYQTARYKRYSFEQTWAGVLQSKLGQNTHVILEGLCGRTVNVDDPDRPEVNGLKHFLPTILSHNPLDLIIIMLGTNDTKYLYHATPQSITDSLREMTKLAQKRAYNLNGLAPEIMIIAPPQFADKLEPEIEEDIFKGARQKLLGLPALYKSLCEEEGYMFLDASRLVPGPKTDGVHLDETAHSDLGQLVYDEIRQNFEPRLVYSR